MFNLEGFIFKHSFNTNKVLYVAEAIGEKYDCKSVDMQKGENKTQEFLKKTPAG